LAVVGTASRAAAAANKTTRRDNMNASHITESFYGSRLM
jgi:Flp pilus assembly protein TadG